MLKRLDIRNYMLVEDISLDFLPGFTVLTGETGAGKSMILGAIDVLFGESLTKDDIRKGAESAIIEGTFSIPDDSEYRSFLSEDYLDEDENEIVIRREVSAKGRSRTFVNDRPAPSSLAVQIRELLVDMHGQREHQSLFKSSKQLAYLDAYCGTQFAVSEVAELYRKRAESVRLLDDLRRQLEIHRKDQSLLSYQLEEIERLGLQPDEELVIEAKLKKLENAEKLTLQSRRLLDLLSEDELSLVLLSGRARTAAMDVAKTDEELKTVADELIEIESRIKDISGQVQDYVESIGVDDEELARLRERRGVLWDMKRKHGVGLDDIQARAGELKELLKRGEQLETEFKRIEKELEVIERDLIRAAKELSKRRNKGVKELGEEIMSSLKPLGFAHGRFEVHLESGSFDSADTIAKSGADKVLFLFSANAGSELSELADVASGGESSRVTLAIKTVLADRMNYPLMIYDEVDIGISGKVADAVGAKLSDLGLTHQLIVITHLPQIASQADSHLLVDKRTLSGTTTTSARFLDEKERVSAIATLLAGAEVSGAALASADELLKSGRTKKKSIRTVG